MSRQKSIPGEKNLLFLYIIILIQIEYHLSEMLGTRSVLDFEAFQIWDFWIRDTQPIPTSEQ